MTPIEAVTYVREKYRHTASEPVPQTYSEYLSSPAWRAKRALVMRRAKYVCEGCGSAPAKEVHHLSYAHKGAEFLFELVALCEDCHGRWHEEPDK